MIEKPKVFKSPKNIAATRKRMCLICGNRTQVQCHHIISVGAGGGDNEWNLMSLCVTHHAEWHHNGKRSFVRKYYSHVLRWLVWQGWEVGKDGTITRKGGARIDKKVTESLRRVPNSKLYR